MKKILFSLALLAIAVLPTAVSADMAVSPLDLNPTAPNGSKNVKDIIDPLPPPDVKLFFIALVLTVIIEFLVLFLLLRFVFKKEGQGVQLKKMILASLLTTPLTIPYLWFVLPQLGMILNIILVGEILVVLVEWIVLWKILKTKLSTAFLLSLICNIVSYVMGGLLFIWITNVLAS